MLYPTSSIELPLSSIGRRRLRARVLPAHGEGREGPQVPHLVVCGNERGNGSVFSRPQVQQGPPGQLLLEAVS